MSRAGRLFLALIVLLGAVLLLTSCTTPLEIVVADYERLEAPESWAEMFDEVKACSGEGGEFQAVRWFTSETVHYRSEEREHFRNVMGVWVEPYDVILRRDVLGTESESWAVKHEIVHVLTQSTDHGHPAFGCAG